MEDRTLKCKECGEDFTFTAGEQEFYAQKGFQNEPARCAPCRRARKQQRSALGNAHPRPQSEVTPFRSRYNRTTY